MITVQPDLAAALSAVDDILNDAGVHFVKDDEGQPNCRTYGARMGEETVRVALAAWHAESEEVEFYGYWEELVKRDVQEGIDPDDSKAWVQLKDGQAFAQWLQGTWKGARA